MADKSEDARFCIFHLRDDGDGSFAAVPGQVGTTFGGASTVADATTKDSPWNLGLATKRSGNVSFQTRKPDTPELQAIRTAWETGGVVGGKALLDEAGNFYYTQDWIVANMEWDGPDADVTTVSIELQPLTPLSSST